MRRLSGILVIIGIFLSMTTVIYASPTGWDYNLTKRCIKSAHSDGGNYYTDTAQCGTDGKNWTIAVQSEKTLGVTCSGVNDQSIPINTPTSPLSLEWSPHIDETGKNNWNVDLTTDLINKSHPCGEGQFTWYTLMDHVGLHGGPFALPNAIKTTATIKLVQQNNTNNATRAFVAWQGFWDGKSHAIEINFNITENWGDANADPDIITTIKNDTTEYVVMNGVPMGISLSPGETKTLTVGWPSIINNLITRRYLTAPKNGWTNTASTAIFIGTEVNNFTPTNAGKTILSITNLRNEDTSMRPGDINADGIIDIFDYNILVRDFGKTGSPGFIPADIDRNGNVDVTDFSIFLDNFRI